MQVNDSLRIKYASMQLEFLKHWFIEMIVSDHCVFAKITVLPLPLNDISITHARNITRNLKLSVN